MNRVMEERRMLADQHYGKDDSVQIPTDYETIEDVEEIMDGRETAPSMTAAPNRRKKPKVNQQTDDFRYPNH